METIDIKEFIEQNYIDKTPNKTFNDIHTLECEEVLDNLGYIKLKKDESKDSAKSGSNEIEKGVLKFRNEYNANNTEFDLQLSIYQINDTKTLTEEELDFLNKLCSLEGGFNLHAYSLNEIKTNDILVRVLNYRLTLLGFTKSHLGSKFDEQTELYLAKINDWSGLKSSEKALEIIGNIELLTKQIVEQNHFKNSKFQHTVYFKNEIDNKSEKLFRFKNNPTQFEGRYDSFPTHILSDFNKVRKSKDKIDRIIADDLNKTMTRLIQLRLWQLGVYQGPLDNHIGNFSLNAIIDTLELYESIYGNTKGFTISDFIIYLRKDYWAINSIFLNQFLELLQPKEATNSETICEEVVQLYHSIDSTQKQEFLNEFDSLLKKPLVDTKNKSYLKVKTRGIKSFYKSISEFINKLIVNVKKGIRFIIDELKNLFKWLKNASTIIYRELKKIYKLIVAGIDFFFGQKVVETTSNKTSIITDFDLNFDSVSIINNANHNIIEKHIEKCNYKFEALNEAANFVGTVVNIIIKLATGPLGWIKLGLELIKWLAKSAFTYKRFSYA